MTSPRSGWMQATMLSTRARGVKYWPAPERDRYVWELRILDRRIKVINAGLFLAVSSAVMTTKVSANSGTRSEIRWRFVRDDA